MGGQSILVEYFTVRDSSGEIMVIARGDLPAAGGQGPSERLGQGILPEPLCEKCFCFRRASARDRNPTNPDSS